MIKGWCYPCSLF